MCHFNNKYCLTFLDNFANVGIRRTTLPATIRRPRPIVIDTGNDNKVIRTLLQVQEINLTNVSKKCVSRYVAINYTTYFSAYTCLRLDVAAFTIHSRLLKCLVKFEIFPALELMG